MLTLGRVPDRLATVVAETPFLQIDGEGTCRLEIPTAATFLVRAGRDIVVAPLIDPGSIEIRNFILGPVLGLLAHQRNLVPLSAAAVCIDGIAVAFAGPSRSGKSTLAAALARRGHAVLADDICVVDMTVRGTPSVLPSSSRLRLWEDTFAALEIAPECVSEPLRTGQGRRFVSFSTPPPVGAAPLAFLCLFGEAGSSQNHAAAVVKQVYGHNFAAAFGDGERRARCAGSLAGLVPIISQPRTSIGDLHAMASHIETACIGSARQTWAQ
jgi:hypothetical protein